MSVIEDTLREFGRSIGMEDLRLRDDGTLVLDVQQVGTLGIELIGERREEVSLSLSRRVQAPGDTACTRLLEMCHYRNPCAWPVRTGLANGGTLLFAIRLETFDFTLPNLHQALDCLDGMHQQSSAFITPA